MQNEKINLLNLSKKELEEFLLSEGFKKFNTKQVFDWLHSKLIRKIDDMTNLSKSQRELLFEKSYIEYFELLNHQKSKKDNTEKFLFQLADKTTIETVLIKHKKRNTLCISSQVGCAVNCAFCATGMGGFTRNLTLSEILNQVYIVSRRLVKKEKTITNIVFMGMGEPFLNTDEVLRSIEILSSEEGLNISKRKIIISTSGFVPGIEKLMSERSQIGLAVSLHSALDDVRTKIMPINKKYPLQDLKNALVQYQKFTNRKVTFEYILLKDINVSPYDAEALAVFVDGIDHTINLIPYNPIEGKEFERPSLKKVERFFYTLLNDYGLNVTLREEKGTDIDGACGQLREKNKDGASSQSKENNNNK